MNSVDNVDSVDSKEINRKYEEEKEEWERHVQKITKSYYDSVGFIPMQLETYNYCLLFGLQNIIDNEPKIDVITRNANEEINFKYRILFGQLEVGYPQIKNKQVEDLLPSKCRELNLTYSAPICCDVTEIYEKYEKGDKKENVSVKKHSKVVIGKIPIMVGSVRCHLSKMSKKEREEKGECPEDQGGYLIIKGYEKVIAAQMRPAYNTIIVLEQKNSKQKFIAEVRSMSNETGHSALVRVRVEMDNNITVVIPFISKPVNAGVVFRALGLDDQEIIDAIGIPFDKYPRTRVFVNDIILKTLPCTSQDMALAFLGKKTMHVTSQDSQKKYAEQVVFSELFPHLGISVTKKEQAIYLGLVLKQLIMTASKYRNPDDRDNIGVKRVEAGGILIYELFRNIFKKFCSEIKTEAEKKKLEPDFLSINSKNKITRQFLTCCANGNWSIQKNAAYVRKGVTQSFDRITYSASLSHKRRIQVPVGKEAKNAELRQIHPSQFGFICPFETPEGKKVGIVLNFALLANVTKKSCPILARQVIEGVPSITDILDIDLKDVKNYNCVFINGIPVGYCEDIEETTKILRDLREKNYFTQETSISKDIVDNVIRIFTDEGRFVRPLLVMSKTEELYTLLKKIDEISWYKLLDRGYIKYLDPLEIEDSLIAKYPTINPGDENTYNYAEIHPSFMLGAMSSIIPFSDHSQSPRNTYQSSMGKQALGIPVKNYRDRTDTILHVLSYPQKPIVSTFHSKFLGYNRMPSGLTAMVAILCYSGYNQEDSLIFNKGSIQRGMFSLTTYKTIEEVEQKKNTYSFEKICLPPKSTDNLAQSNPNYFKRKRANYGYLDADGVITSRIPFERKCTTLNCKKGWFYVRGVDRCTECKQKLTQHRGGENIFVKKGDVIIGKLLVTTSKTGEETSVDTSRIIRDGEEGYIDRVYKDITPDGYKNVKIVIRKYRDPIIGDKFASREAQKGTIGMIFPDHEMPFNENGLTPDIIINPLCMPSRMTINQFIECAMSRLCVSLGKFGDATPFTLASSKIFYSITEKTKLIKKRDGLLSNDPEQWETMYNGFYGERIETKVFMGPNFYQRLKHMVSDKMHARSVGEVTILTRQPLEGRAKDGGLKFGEMERDCIIVHGNMGFLKERLFTSSDPFQVMLCKKCGIMTNNLTDCQKCKGSELVRVNIPYASKLLFQELMAMGISVTFDV